MQYNFELFNKGLKKTDDSLTLLVQQSAKDNIFPS